MRFALGDLTLDDGTRQLLRGDQELRLSPKAFDFLALLVKERPRIVTKTELHEKIWAGVFVSDASIAMVASEVRAALGESARAPRLIRTAHGHGYSFRGNATPVASGPASTIKQWLIFGERVLLLREGDNIVGRDPGADVWIDDPSVSRRHACVRVTAAGMTIEDLNSKNGTFLRDRPVASAVALTSGDGVRFGSALAVCRQSDDGTV